MSKLVFDLKMGTSSVFLDDNVGLKPTNKYYKIDRSGWSLEELSNIVYANYSSPSPEWKPFKNFVKRTPIYYDMKDIKGIEAQNNHKLIVKKSSINLNLINAASGVINFNNACTYDDQQFCDIIIGNNSKVNLTGKDLKIGNLIMENNSTLNFTHNKHFYHLQTPSNTAMLDNKRVQIADMDEFINICEFINHKIKSKSLFILEEISFIRDYHKLDTTLVDLFTTQNNMANSYIIDDFITTNFYERRPNSVDMNLQNNNLKVVGAHINDIAAYAPPAIELEGDIDQLLNNVNLLGDDEQ